MLYLHNPEPPEIVVGAWYLVRQETKGQRWDTAQERSVRMRVVKVYRHHVLFEDERGIRESIDNWSVARRVTRCQT